MLDKLLRKTDFNQIPQERKGPVLEHQRRQILENAMRSPKVLELVLANKEDIARLFREIGGAEQEATARFFEELRNTTDIVNALPEQTRQRLQRRVEDTMNKPKWEFFVFGEALLDEQVSTVKRRNAGRGKHGKQIPIDIIGLFRCKQNGGPIYLNVEKNPALMKQLSIITTLRPDLIQRLYFVEWGESGEAILTQYKEESPVHVGTQLQHLRTITSLGEYINYAPKRGDVFMGTVVEIEGSSGVIVEFLPGITGKIRINDTPGSDNEEDDYHVGMRLKVGVGDICGKDGRVDHLEDEYEYFPREYEPPHKLSYILYPADEDTPIFQEFGGNPGLPMLSNAPTTSNPATTTVDIVIEE